MILIPATIESLSTRKDKTIKITISTQELLPSQSSDIFSLQDKYVFMAIKQAEFQSHEVDMLAKAKADIEVQGKSNSERLRNVMFILWNQDSGGYKDFTDFYRHKMNGIIDHFKTKIV